MFLKPHFETKSKLLKRSHAEAFLITVIPEHLKKPWEKISDRIFFLIKLETKAVKTCDQQFLILFGI